MTKYFVRAIAKTYPQVKELLFCEILELDEKTFRITDIKNIIHTHFKGQYLNGTTLSIDITNIDKI